VFRAAFAAGGHVVTQTGVRQDGFGGGYQDVAVRVWSAGVATDPPRLLATFPDAKHGDVGLGVSSDGARVAGARDRKAVLWGVDGTATEIDTGGVAVRSAVYDAGRLVVVTEQGVEVRDEDGAGVALRLPLPNAGTSRLSVDGRRLVTLRADGARVWDVASGAPLSLPLPGWSWADFSGDGGLLLVQDDRLIDNGRHERTLRVYDAEGLPVTPAVVMPKAFPGGWPALRPDGRRFLLSDGNRLAIYDLPAFEGDAWPREDLLDLVRLYAARRLDAAGLPVPLSDDETMRLWGRLRGRHPSLFGAGP
jgi:hypothetical protein